MGEEVPGKRLGYEKSSCPSLVGKVVVGVA